MIFINFKTYEQGTGDNAEALVQTIESIAESSHVKLIPVVQAVDLATIASTTKLEVWIQKVDSIDFGAHTGATLPESALEAGAIGTFLNHSENKIASFEELTKTHMRAKEVGLKTLIFASSLTEFKKILTLKPDFIAYEPEELVGSSEKSVASERPEIITDAFNLSKEQGIPLIVGAGIHSREDIKTSLNLGASGFAVASDILKAHDPKAELLDLIEGYN
ncbi:hypothetical protein A2382_04205 [Candidatus Woesebacteria bacterium RIFOXYB1_FULL_38_16]|uniref:Uncharacterized protein n=1 Tax=Candidatus Woesebacteria bacterium RIFOXYB1_FULL_38_16 TaxID=1802538 RepID=A0A1F8CTW7_9BACT|nr:MAG: hypothetical protein A2191_04280 [Candidatus Woesebacteria bacterium RIFOXYA1_FULL_38_9]OGM79773.1 MAG: hypothetical protein A2382_04205 [Candidatus Woesebacteria bacterium RIFOXYB1_FULL_38_16]